MKLTSTNVFVTIGVCGALEAGRAGNWLRSTANAQAQCITFVIRVTLARANVIEGQALGIGTALYVGANV